MPERMCVACRRKAPPEAFFRMVVAPGGEVIPELDSSLPGRGAHCCFERACVRAALGPKVLERALRGKVAIPEEEPLFERLAALLRERMKGFLSAGKRKGAVAAGREAALRASNKGSGGEWFFAEDLSEGSRLKAAGKGAEGCTLPMRMQEVGEALGSKPVGVLFVSDDLLARSLSLRAAQARALRTT